MSNTLATASTPSLLSQYETKNKQLFQVVDAYLSTVKTAKGSIPSQAQKENFLIECMVNNLNPIKKQAYLIGYDTKTGPTFSTIISISGFLSIAQRTGSYAGISQPRWTYNDGRIDTCSVSVFKKIGEKAYEFSGQAYMDERMELKAEYEDNRPTGRKIPKGLWATQPRTMLEKCARAAALRNAFPEELGDKYEEVEMPNTSVDVVKVEEATIKVQFRPISQTQKDSIMTSLEELAESQATTSQELLAKILTANNCQTLEEVTEPLASKLVSILNDKVSAIQMQPRVKVQEVETVNPDAITKGQLSKMHAMFAEMSDGAEMKATIKAQYEVDSIKDLSKAQVMEVIDGLETLKAQA